MLILYGIQGKRCPLLRSHRTLRANPACVVLLGIYAWIALTLPEK